MQKTAKSGVFLRISKVESADVFVGFVLCFEDKCQANSADLSCFLICFVVFFRLISWL